MGAVTVFLPLLRNTTAVLVMMLILKEHVYSHCTLVLHRI